jgi:Tol biopolymer transport system component
MVAACSYQPARLDPGAGDDTDGPSMEIDATAADAFVGPPPTPCVERWLAGTMQLATPVEVAGAGIVTSSDERDPFVSADGRVLYFASPDLGDLQVWFAKRDQASGPFGSLQVKATLSTNLEADGKVTITDDDLVAFVSTRRANGTGGAFDFWQASRASGFDQPFGTLSQNQLGMLNDADDQQDPHVSPDGLRLYFAAGNPQQVVVSSRIAVLAEFPPATPIANLSDGSGDADPTLTGDERVIIFTSNRNAANQSDLFYATRSERDRPFGAPLPLAINSTFQDGDAHLSPDGCTLYFASTREGSGDYDLYVTSEVPVSQ